MHFEIRKKSGPRIPTQVWRSLLLLTLSIALGYVLHGYVNPSQNDIAIEEAIQEKRKSAALERQLSSAREALVDSHRRQQMAESANQLLTSNIGDLEKSNKGLANDLAFYQRLLAKGGESPGLAVHDLVLHGTNSNRVYDFDLTLRQNLKKANIVKGFATVEIAGIAFDEPKRISMRPGVAANKSKISFNFKYFQQVSGHIVLPEDFDAKKVIVSLNSRSSGKKRSIERTFLWSEALEPG